ncbi:calcium-binding protein [Erythrobacter alti]|uniref:calcium-binding protein n=1 Tax=Erythrobacter alti TaxID=1896145 RepID=UPI0030F43EB9
MSILDLNARFGLLNIGLYFDLITIDLEIGINPSSGTTDDDVTAGTTGNDAIETLLGDDIIIGSDGEDVIDGSIGIDIVVFDFSSSRHVSQGIGRNVTITDTLVSTDEGTLPTDADVISVISGIEGLAFQFGAMVGGEIVDTTDDTVDASLFLGSEGVQLFSGGGTDTFIGSGSDDVFSFVMGAGTATIGTATGGGGNDIGMLRVEASGTQTVTMSDVGGVFSFSNGDGEQVTLNGMSEIGFAAAGLVAGGSGGTTTINAASATTVVLADFTEGGTITNYNAVFLVNTGGGDDIIQTNAGNDIINAGSGADQMAGGAGDDIYYVDNVGDIVTENVDEGTDRVYFAMNTTAYAKAWANVESFGLTGTASVLRTSNLDNELVANSILGSVLYGRGGNDVLIGGAENDRLEGGSGNDEMRGGQGDDIYRVEDAGDIVVEFTSEGRDLVRAKIDYTLGANVEDLKLQGAASIGTGNDLANDMQASANAVTLYGLGGNDRLTGSFQNDTLYGGDGDDALFGSAGSDFLYGGNDNDVLYGGGGIDFMFGEDGDDRLHGGTGNDELSGGAGNDTLYGDSHNDTLVGGAGIDRLFGGLHDDILIGGSDRDALFGGSGADTFVWDDGDFGGTKASNADRIYDFSSAQGDLIDLSLVDAIFGGDDDAFTFIDNEGFSGTAGELRWQHLGDNTMIYMDIDGDAQADYAILLDGTLNLSQADFVL